MKLWDTTPASATRGSVMDRRTFLKSTAFAAAPAFLRQRSCGSGKNPAGKHLVLVMMENRSFDHLLGWLPNADGKQAGLQFPNKTGGSEPTFELAPDFTGCKYPVPDHSYAGGRVEIDAGKMDGFLKPASSGLNAIGYYTEKDLPFSSALARNYTTCDHYFSSFLGPTYPNRLFQHCGQTDRIDNSLKLSSLPTIWDRLQAAGISHHYYFNNIPFLALWGLKYVGITRLYSDFLSDCAAGKLPAVSFVDPTFTTLGNLADDDEPHSDVRNGDAFLAKTFHALSTSPNWPDTIFVVNFDEWGGFFDHVPPPRAIAPNNVDTDLVDGKALLGCRIPCIVASPWTRGNPASPRLHATVCDHTSVLKLIESIWKLPPLATREQSQDTGNLLDALDLNHADTAVPAMPDPQPVRPSSLCSSSFSPAAAPSTPEPSNNSPAAYQKMLDTGMVKGFPGH